MWAHSREVAVNNGRISVSVKASAGEIWIPDGYGSAAGPGDSAGAWGKDSADAKVDEIEKATKQVKASSVKPSEAADKGFLCLRRMQ